MEHSNIHSNIGSILSFLWPDDKNIHKTIKIHLMYAYPKYTLKKYEINKDNYIEWNYIE